MVDLIVEAIQKLEKSLFLRDCMSDASYLEAVLSDGFEECGKSGRLRVGFSSGDQMRSHVTRCPFRYFGLCLGF